MNHPARLCFLPLFLLLSATALSSQQQAPQAQFALHNGDTVVFYGDSITEQRQYTSDVEMFTLTRFPQLKVRFFNAGVGGDKVSGGWAGPIDLRLERDVFAARPNVVTIMLGMNDGYYRPFDEGIVSTYTDGYRHLLDSIQSRLPDTRIVLLEPSPFDDVTRAPQWDPGYNSVMQQFGGIVLQLARERNLAAVNLNTPVTAVLAKAKQIDPVMATTLVPDRVHPGPAAHWILAEALLRSWAAPSIVSSTSLDAGGNILLAENTTVTEVQHGKDGLRWLQLDKALPLPLPAGDVDPFLRLTLQASDLTEALDQQPLQISGLAPGNYQLLIDGQPAGRFSADDLAKGVNLALLDTPMLMQARIVALDTDRKNQIEAMHFTQQNDVRDANAQAIAAKLNPELEKAFQRQRADAQPIPHRFQLIPITGTHSSH